MGWKRHLVPMLMALLVLPSLPAADTDYQKELQSWRDAREKKLREENGWLSLAGRFTLKSGDNSFGTGKGNDVVFPTALIGTGPDHLGILQVDETGKRVKLRLAEGVTMVSNGKPFTGERDFDTEKPDWVGIGRFRMHIIVREGKNILRLADNESLVRKNFPGCQWYRGNEDFRVEATFISYPVGKTIPIVNVLDQVSHQPCPGYAEFKLKGETYKLDAIAEGAGLFFVFRDKTAGDTTYQPARFITVDLNPGNNGTFTLDFNKAYNPPCAISDFTTCPTAPDQNVLPIRIEAGEKYGKRK